MGQPVVDGRVADAELFLDLSPAGFCDRSLQKCETLFCGMINDINVGIIPSDGAHATIEQIPSFVHYMTELMISDISQDIAFLNADPSTTWWYNGETIKFRSPRTVLLLSHLQQHPKATISELSSTLGINTSAVQKQLSNLEDKGYITKDPDTKVWRVIAVPTTK